MSDSKIYKENLVKLEELFNKKQEAFEDTFSSLFKKYGLIGTTIKISDKFSKLQKLLLINNSNETIKKYLLDIANYCMLTLVELDKLEKNSNIIKDTNEYSWYKNNTKTKKIGLISQDIPGYFSPINNTLPNYGE